MKKEIRKQAKKIASRFGKTIEQKQDIEGRCLEAAWKAGLNLEEDKNSSAYLGAIMRNTALTYLRKEPQVSCISLESSSIAIESHERSVVEQIDFDRKFKKFLLKLSPADKEIILLFVAGYSLSEISKEIRIAPNTLAVRIHRNRKIWKDYYLQCENQLEQVTQSLTE